MAKSGNPRKLSQSKQFAQVEHFSLLGADVRTGPLSLWQYAEAFIKAAKELPPSTVPFEPVRYYLVCHSIELSLKAFLALHGKTIVDLSENAYGHNLQTILKVADDNDLGSIVPLSAALRSDIQQAVVYYTGKVFEYPAFGEALRGYPNLPNIVSLTEAATVLVESLRQPCLESP